MCKNNMKKLGMLALLLMFSMSIILGNVNYVSAAETLTVQSTVDNNNVTIDVTDSANSEDPVSILIFTKDATSLVYMDQGTLSNGKYSFSTVLPKGEYTGYVNSKTATNVSIGDVVVTTEEVITSLKPVSQVEVQTGAKAELPTYLIAVYDSGANREVAVEWDSVDTSKPGTKTVEGTVVGYTGKATATVVVSGDPIETKEDFTVNSTFNLDSLKANATLDVKTVVTNNNNTSIGSVLVIVALYGPENDMVNVSYISKDIAVGQTEALNAGFKLPEDVTNHKVRVFVWDGTSITDTTMQPISNVVELQ